jgi:hypothetical protein
MTTTAIQLPDTARRIAIDYYRNAPHVFGPGYPEKEICTYCGCFESTVLNHIAATPKPAPTVVEVVTVRPGNFLINGSCKHEPRGESFFDQRHRPSQKVGDRFDCWTCDSQWHDQNYPGLPEAVQAQIQALVPHCPECGEAVKYIPFIVFSKHDVLFELDGGIGTLDGQSQECDTLDVLPDWEHAFCLGRDVTDLADGWQAGEIAVSCENDHDWKTRQLAWKSEGSEHRWRVIDAPAS